MECQNAYRMTFQRNPTKSNTPRRRKKTPVPFRAVTACHPRKCGFLVQQAFCGWIKTSINADFITIQSWTWEFYCLNAIETQVGIFCTDLFLKWSQIRRNIEDFHSCIFNQINLFHKPDISLAPFRDISFIILQEIFEQKSVREISLVRWFEVHEVQWSSSCNFSFVHPYKKKRRQFIFKHVCK